MAWIWPSWILNAHVIRSKYHSTTMKKLLILCSIIPLFVSCKKDVTELPPATQTGANTFGAMVDGKMWIPQRFGPITSGTILEARLLGGNFYLTAQNFSSSPTETEFD